MSDSRLVQGAHQVRREGSHSRQPNICRQVQDEVGFWTHFSDYGYLDLSGLLVRRDYFREADYNWQKSFGMKTAV